MINFTTNRQYSFYLFERHSSWRAKQCGGIKKKRLVQWNLLGGRNRFLAQVSNAQKNTNRKIRPSLNDVYFSCNTYLHQLMVNLAFVFSGLPISSVNTFHKATQNNWVKTNIFLFLFAAVKYLWMFWSFQMWENGMKKTLNEFKYNKQN